MSFDIFDTGTGWITPKGDLIGCGFYEHIQTIMDHDEVKDIDEVKEIKEDLQECEKECEELAERGEHPEWHHYEIAESRARWDIRDILVEYGFIRVGTNLKQGYVEGEGRGNAIASKMPILRKIAVEHGIRRNMELGVITTSLK